VSYAVFTLVFILGELKPLEVQIIKKIYF